MLCTRTAKVDMTGIYISAVNQSYCIYIIILILCKTHHIYMTFSRLLFICLFIVIIISFHFISDLAHANRNETVPTP